MSTARTFGLGAIGQIALEVYDLERAVAFYRDVLGVRFLFDVPGRMAFFDCDGTWLMLAVPEEGVGEGGRGAERRDRGGPRWVLYFDVADIGEAHGVLVERGVAFLTAPHEVADLGESALWMAFFRDADGNTLALRSRVAKGA